MNCKNCGTGLEEDANFCNVCGTKRSADNIANETFVAEKNEALFYSQNWERTRIMTFSVLPRFDILITQKFLYLIKLPKSLAHDIGGVLLGSLGQTIANSTEKKVGNKVRSAWLDSNQQLISSEYEKIALLKIPKENLKSSLELKKSFRKRLAIFTYGNEKVTLQGNKTEYERFKTYIESHVL